MFTLAIDASSANKANKTGVEWYAYHVIQHMKKQALKQGERVFLYTPDPLEGALADLPQGWETRTLRWPPRRGWMPIRVAAQLMKDAPDVFFVPAQGLPPARSALATVIHDVGPLRHSDLYPSRFGRQVRAATLRAVHRANILFAASEFTKNELIRMLHVDPARIVVASNAADTDVYKRMDPEQVRRVCDKYRIGGPFFLTVGRTSPHKNFQMLAQAFRLFASRRGVGDPFVWVHVGEPLSQSAEGILQLGYVDAQEVAALMNACTAFVSPSLYEGFGVPNLEAMSCGAPVVCSSIEPYREVCQDAAVYVQPTDPQAWASALAHVADDTALQNEMRSKGLARSKAYGWEATAQILWESLRNLV